MDEQVPTGATGSSEERSEASGRVPKRAGVSPYATGGGGVTLERRVGALYLARLLTAATSAELGDGRSVLSVAFQQAPRVAIDDLVIHAARADEAAPSLELAIGIRRRPNFVKSDEETQKLIVEYIRALLNAPDDGGEHRLGLAVAARQTHAEQIAELAALARNQMDASTFFALVGEQGRFTAQLRTRLEHVESLVEGALRELKVSGVDEALIRKTAWQLLQRLFVLMPRVEEPDLSDWTDLQNDLVSVARGGDQAAAGHLLDRLETLAGQYAPSAATVDRTLLRRDTHFLLESARFRTARAWELLDHLQRNAQVPDRVGEGGDSDALHLDRDAQGAAVMSAARSVPALVVSGESGVGKSALVLSAAQAAADADESTEVLSLNLRQLPERSFDLVAQLGCSLETLLAEMSAPDRFLIVDAADAATESWRDVFAYLVDAAQRSDVHVIAVTSNEGRQVVHDVIASRVDGQQVASHDVPGLSDEQLEALASGFPQLAVLVSNPRSRELLRRLVVVDLLVRSQFSGIPLSDVDAMNQVWAGLVRRHGSRERGSPGAREQTLLRLASRELTQDAPAQVTRELDAAAIDGLRRDGLLRSSRENPWQVLPEFAHDEIRRYSVARVLLADGDPAAAILEVGAPRWALSAARLASQGVLALPERADSPKQGRVGRLQAEFDRVVEAGHGSRWADVPTEALLTLGDPGPLLADAWPELRGDDEAGLRRLLRLIDQRHRDAVAIVDPVVAEPVIALLLDDEAPWRNSDETAKVLREWLFALVVRNTPAGHPLRLRLRERLLDVCAKADAEQEARAQAAVAARAAMTDEEREQERQNAQRERSLFSELGIGRRSRRRRPEIPREIRDDTLLELFALLGPDLGETGEQILRRVAVDAPWDLAPAVEEIGTGRALASYGHGLLADLVEAYYLDEDEDGSRFHEEGIRHHRWRGPVAPLAAWYRGPFGSLFQSDFRGGIAVLNRLLNHAARARIRTLAGIYDRWNLPTDEEIDASSIELRISGEPSRYAGDDHVWYWYRGTGVGPYPCMSALQALERVCDQVLSVGLPMDRLVAILLEGCENLAMPALVVGILVRHIEHAGTLLDPFLAEPAVWQLEFSRVVHESGGLAASSEGLVERERRMWSCREAASWLTLNADPERAEVLRTAGDQLVARAKEIQGNLPAEQDQSAQPAGEAAGSPSLSTLAEGWASALDRSRYRAYREGDQVYVQSSPPEEVEEALKSGNQDLQRGQEVLRIQWRYFAGGALGRQKSPPPVGEELTNDLAIAEGLLSDPPRASAVAIWDMAAAAAAHAVEVVVRRGESLPTDALAFAVKVVLAVAEGAEPKDEFEYYGTFYEQGADRLAASALPLLLLPSAAPLRDLARTDEGESAESRIVSAGCRLAHAAPNETRVYLARGLDPVWEHECHGEGRCHHAVALELATEAMRDCILGPWDQASQQRRIEKVGNPIGESMDAIPDDDVLVPRLDAGLRALGAAATRESCVQEQARDLLAHVLDTQRRGLLAYDKNFDDRGTHMLEAARALLWLSAAGDDAPLGEAIAAYADNSARLAGLLRGLAAAAEETQPAADAARRVWPSIIEQVLDLSASGHSTFTDRYYGERALAALIPTPVHEIEFLYRELKTCPIAWTDPLAWQGAIDAWVSVAAGDSDGVDAFIGLVRTLSEREQSAFGLPRVAKLVLHDVDAIARRSYFLADWLIALRETAVAAGSQPLWQEVVDALVVAGDRTLAPYSE